MTCRRLLCELLLLATLIKFGVGLQGVPDGE